MVVDLSGGPDAEQYPVTYLDAEPEGGWTEEYKTDKLVLRRIEAGTFVMGHQGSDYPTSWANMLHEVTISKPFCIGVFEVTQKQYESIMGATPSEFSGKMRPVESVSWNAIRGDTQVYDWPTAGSSVDENSFMGKLRAKTGIDTFDLPTEAKWEYACRAGTTTALNNGKNMAGKEWDPAMDEVGRYGYNNGFISGNPDGMGGYDDHHTTVGSYLPNAWGLYDMHGNVWEWCLDWWRDDFSSQAATDPGGPLGGTSRLLRGGSWYDNADCCRSGYRGGVPPNHEGNNCGLRISCAAGAGSSISAQAESESE